MILGGAASMVDEDSGFYGADDRLKTTNGILLKARAGDQAAFESLMRSHERQVYTCAWRILGDRSDAEDVTQEVFIRLFENLDRLNEDRPLGPWIYRVTVNTCLNLRRKKKVRKAVSLDWLGLGREPRSRDRASDPRVRAQVKEEESIAKRALATLPIKERLALVLRDIQGFTTREVAEILGSSEATVRSQVCRARMKIRDFRKRIVGRPSE